MHRNRRRKFLQLNFEASRYTRIDLLLQNKTIQQHTVKHIIITNFLNFKLSSLERYCCIFKYFELCLFLRVQVCLVLTSYIAEHPSLLLKKVVFFNCVHRKSLQTLKLLLNFSLRQQISGLRNRFINCLDLILIEIWLNGTLILEATKKYRLLLYAWIVFAQLLEWFVV